ncbi:DNA repair protein REV1 like [Verticillium longisporum]|uniref:DNA repair protein REV1 like n=1 Tax=Verticillium longisporum TaxID=100787 RepID=A0A8I2ZMN7_VERLO|nr:DNA repair protein REV1 like [Verticillium longisporum]
MPQPPNNPLPPSAQPRLGKVFDPWNSSSTGHQRPDTRPGLGWRDSRNRKLVSQFRAGHTGGARESDTHGAGSEDFDPAVGAVVPKAVRERAKCSVHDMLLAPGRMRETLPAAADDVELGGGRGRGLFDGVVVYVNGSTAPLVSDHKFKRLLAENGARISLHLGRRQVTHVIVGQPVGGGRGSGGGLAGMKLEREIKKMAGCAVKYVTAEWVLESLKAGKRLSEARFAALKVAREGQRSVLGTYTTGPVASASKTS